MAAVVEIIPWLQDSDSPIEKQWRELTRTSNNLSACLATPEWLLYRWKPRANVFLAVLRERTTNVLLGVTPMVQNKHEFPLFSFGTKVLYKVSLNGLLLNGGVPLFCASDQGYESLCEAALNMPKIDCLYLFGVPTTSEFGEFLARENNHQQWLRHSVKPQKKYFYINMMKTYDEYCAQFNPKVFRNIRRELRLLESESGGHLDLIRVTAPDQVPFFLAEAPLIAEKSWQHNLIDLHFNAPGGRRELLESMALQGVLR
jgi:hypothetical protein